MVHEVRHGSRAEEGARLRVARTAMLAAVRSLELSRPRALISCGCAFAPHMRNNGRWSDAGYAATFLRVFLAELHFYENLEQTNLR